MVMTWASGCTRILAPSVTLEAVSRGLGFCLLFTPRGPPSSQDRSLYARALYTPAHSQRPFLGSANGFGGWLLRLHLRCSVGHWPHDISVTVPVPVVNIPIKGSAGEPF